MRKLTSVAVFCCLIFAFLACSKQLRPAEVYPQPEPTSLIVEPPDNPDAFITAFYQGGAGNCASIAVIKLAMARYGCNNVYKSKTESGDSQTFTLQNNSTVTLTKSELESLKTYDRFQKGTNEIAYNEARLLYAIIAKNKAIKEGITPEKAAKKLNGAENLGAEDLFPFLGLQSDNVSVEKLAAENKAIATNRFHAAFSSNGYYDEYGTKASLSQFEKNHRKLFYSSKLANGYKIKSN